ncbi:MAG: head GIN domain-containing protein [Bacteroidota bacterium]
MKQKILFLSFSLLVLLFSTSCIFMGPPVKGNGDVMQETRTTDDFDKIKVSRGMNVYITQGDFTKVVVKADENLLDIIETVTEGDVLVVTTNSNIRKAKEKKVFVTTPHLEAIKCFAGSNVFSEDTIREKEMELSCSAGSNIKLELVSNHIEASAMAGSNIKLEGEVQSFYGKASSGSNIKAMDLVARKCDVKTSSGANIWITVNNSLMGSASSGGNIFYYGDPEDTDIHKSSGGNVIKKTE